MKRAILIIDSTYPTPDRDSGSQDTVNFIRMFQRLGLAVGYISTSQFNHKALDKPSEQEARAQLEACDVRIIDCHVAGSIAEYIEVCGAIYQYIFLSRIYAGGIFFEQVRRHAPESRVLFNTVDLHYVREERESRLLADPAARIRAGKTRAREMYLARMSDATIVVSEAEFSLIRDNEPGAPVRHLPLVRDVPGRKAAFSERQGVGFLGGYRHLPNVDAVEYFLSEIWPTVILKRPDLKFYLFGADMPDVLAKRNDPGLIVVGHVADLRDVFESIRVSVAPLRYGAGAKGKVVSSLAHGVPCVLSPVAAEGMMLEKNQGISIAESIEQFADEIISLHEDHERWEQMSRGAIARMERDFSFEVGLDRMQDVLDLSLSFERCAK